jgi:signal transduction histidine kinase
MGQIFEVFSTNVQTKWFFVVFEYFAICFIGATWLLFSLSYLNHKIIQSRKNIILLCIAPATFFILVMTNEYHHMFYTVFEYDYRTYGIFFWSHLALSYIYLLMGTAILIKCLVKGTGYKRKQTILLIFAALIPIVSNIIHVFKIIKLGIDITSVGFTFSLMFFAMATFKYRFLNIVPIALQKAVDNIKESIIVVDNFNKIIDYNNAFIKTFLSGRMIENSEDINDLLNKINKNIDKTKQTNKLLEAIQFGTETCISGELTLKGSEIKCYTVNVYPIVGAKKEVLGRVVTFNDISSYKKLLKELNAKNEELSIMNEQLKEHLYAVEELAVMRERNRFAREVHDTLGHTMTSLITLMQVSKIAYKKNTDEGEETLSKGIEIARQGLKEIRRSISGLFPQKLESNTLTDGLKQLINEFQNLGINIELNIYGEEWYRSSACFNAVYRICQEAITNSIRHGKAQQINIILRLTDNRIKLFIIDNGCGCKKIKKGFGLLGMEERVKELNGLLTYGSDGESGFNIHVEIPIGDDDKK